jgi:hypothetical protein
MYKQTLIRDLQARVNWYAQFLLDAPETHPMWDRHLATYQQLKLELAARQSHT